MITVSHVWFSLDLDLVDGLALVLVMLQAFNLKKSWIVICSILASTCISSGSACGYGYGYILFCICLTLPCICIRHLVMCVVVVWMSYCTWFCLIVLFTCLPVLLFSPFLILCNACVCLFYSFPLLDYMLCPCLHLHDHVSHLGFSVIL